MKVKIIRPDKALELGGGSLISEFFASHKIIHQTPCVATSQNNGVVERKHRHLLETSRAFLHQSKVPISYWGECMFTATFLINRFPSRTIKHKTPYELLFGKKPTYDFLRSFGCLCYVSPLSHNI